jgi:hypothetical protein
MRKVHLLLIGMLAMASTTVAAVPQGHSSVTVAPAAVVSTTNANTTTAPATAPLTLAEVFAPATPSAGACNLLCIQGYHCCVKGNKAQCIPNDQPCP